MDRKRVVVQARINKPIEKVWDYHNKPAHIIEWNSASENWHTSSAVNDFNVGGSFNYRMEAKDGSYGFDFSGKYDEIITNKRIEYTLDDDRKVVIEFDDMNEYVNVKYSFEIEDSNSAEMQRDGWQAILDNFKKYCESK